ncbi:unnamed protein product [Ambrosiozyma monospora]|uniref:Unnamed protein product n=1 Tax=Ambrosiozyma monospora TaxID=43982 RepID=A0ACB5U1S6_AMBMO|nr:unnamed protein product [Ambrosiozyma monospora]
MDTASNFSQPKLGGAGNVRASRVESFVLPFAEETHSKHSLEILSKQLGSDYDGYRIPEQESRIHSANVSRRSSFASHGFPASRSTDNLSKNLTANPSKINIPPSASSDKLHDSPLEKTASGSPSKLRTQINSLDSDSDRLNSRDTTSMSPVTYETPNESLVPDDKKIGNNDNNSDEFHLEDPSNWAKEAPTVSEFDDNNFNNSGNLAANNSNNKNKKIEHSPADVLDLPDTLDDDAHPEEDEQFKRMKSVYKVYFSRENSVRTKKGEDEYQFNNGTGNEELPPLPTYPDQAVSKDNLLSLPQPMSDDPRASYSSSIYVPMESPMKPTYQT